MTEGDKTPIQMLVAEIHKSLGPKLDKALETVFMAGQVVMREAAAERIMTHAQVKQKIKHTLAKAVRDLPIEKNPGSYGFN